MTTQQTNVTQADLEPQGWDWLAGMVEAMCDEDPSDLAYSADQMVDAFIGGYRHRQSAEATAKAEVERLRSTIRALHNDLQAHKDALAQSEGGAQAVQAEAKIIRLFDGLFDAKITASRLCEVLERLERMAHEAMQEGPERSEKRRWDDLRAIYVMAGDAARKARAAAGHGYARAFDLLVGDIQAAWDRIDELPPIIFSEEEEREMIAELRRVVEARAALSASDAGEG